MRPETKADVRQHAICTISGVVSRGGRIYQALSWVTYADDGYAVHRQESKTEDAQFGTEGLTPEESIGVYSTLPRAVGKAWKIVT